MYYKLGIKKPPRQVKVVISILLEVKHAHVFQHDKMILPMDQILHT